MINIGIVVFLTILLIFILSYLSEKIQSNKCKSSNISLANKYIPKYEIKSLSVNTSYFLKKLLEKLGVFGAVGIPGTSTLYFYQQIVRDPNWKVILSRHESNAGFMANGSFRSSRYTNRKFIIAFATTGPGSSNLCTPIADNTCDYVPSIYITNDLADYNLKNPININRNRNIQDVDPEDIFGGLAKVIVRIDIETAKSGQFIDNIVEGFRKSFTFPQGPLVIVVGEGTANTQYDQNKTQELYQKINSIPDLFKSNIGTELKEEYKIYSYDNIIGFKVPNQYDTMNDNFYKKNSSKIITSQNSTLFLNDSLLESKQPLIIVGNGCFDIIDSLYDWIHTYNIPYLTTLPLQGYTNKYDPICARRMGHTATYTGNNTVYNSDWILCLGISFNNYQFISNNKNDICPNAKHIISWNLYPELTDVPLITNYIIGDVSDMLKWNPTYKTPYQWLDKIKNFKIKDFELEKSVFYKKSDILQYGTIISAIQKCSDSFISKNPTKKVWIVTDVGMTQVTCASLFTFRNKDNYKLITSAKYGTVGSGLGMAMGVALSNPEDLVVLVAGDLGIQMSLPDWITIKESKINNLAVFVTENSGFNLIESENHELGLTNIPDANGYAQTIDWIRMLEGTLIPHYIWKNNNKEKHVIKLLENTLFKSSFFCICVVEHDIMVSPIVSLNTPIINMHYFPGGKAKKFNKVRGDLISHS